MQPRNGSPVTFLDGTAQIKSHAERPRIPLPIPKDLWAHSKPTALY
jgi:hypothetical protein